MRWNKCCQQRTDLYLLSTPSSDPRIPQTAKRTPITKLQDPIRALWPLARLSVSTPLSRSISQRVWLRCALHLSSMGRSHLLEAVSARRAGGFEKGEHGHDPAIDLAFFDEAKLLED
jgi:hypothetical protein